MPSTNALAGARIRRQVHRRPWPSLAGYKLAGRVHKKLTEGSAVIAAFQLTQIVERLVHRADLDAGHTAGFV